MKITIIGTGYVGLTSAACLAELGHEIMCLDIDSSKITKLESGIIPFFEPGLDQLVKKNIQKNKLLFTTNSETAIKCSEAIFNCVGTPSKDNGEADLSAVFKVAETVAKYADN